MLEIKQYLLDGVDQLPDLVGATVSGGRLNIYNSINLMPVVSVSEDNLPISPIKLSNYPNPFNPSTTISFDINTEINEDSELIIYNLKGQLIKELPVILSGVEGSVVWNGNDDNNQPVSSGIYFYKLNVENSPVNKMLLMK